VSILLTLALLAVLFIAQDLLRPKPRLENARPEQLKFPTTAHDRPVSNLWGTVRVKGPNVIWYGDTRQDPISIRVKTSIIFNTGKRQITGYRYYAGIQLGLCRGDETCKLLRWSIGEKEVWSGVLEDGDFIDIDDPTFFGGDTLGSGGLRGRLRFHAGVKTSAPNAYLAAFQTVDGAQPRYTGTSYVVWEGGYIGNSNRIDAWDFDVQRIPNGLGLSGDGKVNGLDANIMNAAYELFTSSEFPYQFAAGDIDLSQWSTAGTTLASEGNGFSMLLDTTIEATQLIEEFERQADGIFYLDHRVGKWRFKLSRNDYDIDLVPQLLASDIKEARDFTRGTWTDTSNFVRVRFSNRENEYQEDYGIAIDMANAMMQGGLSTSTANIVPAEETYPGVKDSTLATAIAFRDLRVLGYPLAKATFAVTRKFWDVTPNSVVAYTDPTRGIAKMPMRVQKIDYGELQRGFIVLSSFSYKRDKMGGRRMDIESR
jgi:hypothetical protein